MVDSIRPAAPSKQTVTIACSGTTARAFICRKDGPVSLRLLNEANATVFLAWGGSSIEATTSGLPIPAGAVEVLTFSPAADGSLYMAAIGGTGNLRITIVSGL